MISNNIEDALLPLKVNESKGDLSRSSPEHQGEQKKKLRILLAFEKEIV